MCPGSFFKDLRFLMNWKMIIPSMTAVDGNLWNFLLLLLKALIHSKYMLPKWKSNFSNMASFFCQAFGNLDLYLKANFWIHWKIHTSSNIWQYSG